jgi:ribosomal protein S18 acetylase RimI-like enzyme
VPELRSITAAELGRISEIDVSEEGTTVYVQHGMNLEPLSEPHRRLQRTADDWAPEINLWSRFVLDGGQAFGVFESGRMVGFAVLRTGLGSDTAQLAGLYVDRAWRRQGLASSLVAAAVDAAVAAGEAHLYVSAVPSGSAVGFYLSRGFEPLGTPHPELFEREPEDVHMSLTF